MNNQPILIVGSRGQLGSDMVKICNETGYRVVDIDFPQIDITDRESVLRIADNLKPPCIINCAAYTAVDNCEYHEKEAFAINAEGPKNLALAAEMNDSLLVHISTDYVFNGTKASPYVESDMPDPQTVYGKSKLKGEQLVSENCLKHQIFRIAWLYGLHGNNFVKAIRSVAAKKSISGEPLKVVNDQFGTPTYTVEVCRQILKTIDSGEYGIFHCTCEGWCSWYDFALEIINKSDFDIPVIPCSTSEFPRPAPRPSHSVLENARLKGLGLQNLPDWRDAFGEFLKEESMVFCSHK